MRRSVPIAAMFISLVLVVGVASCRDTKTPVGNATSGPVDYSKPGPYPVGITTFDLGDRIAYVFYPADAARLGEGTRVTSYSSADAFPGPLRALLPPELIQNVPIDATRNAPIATDGPFPVVIHSHGFGGYPEYTSQHLIQLASWGIVSAAPDHIERDLAATSLGTAVGGENDVQDLRKTLDRLETENASGIFSGALNLQEIAAEGHSAGGGAAGKFAYDPEVKTFIGQAAVAPLRSLDAESATAADVAAGYASQAPPQKPSMLLAGEVDAVVPVAEVKAEYAWLATPKRLAVIGRAGHNSFTDLCKPIRAQGGLMQYSGKLPAPDELLRLGEDGCTDANLDPDTGYAVINQLTVAQLRYVFGIDTTDASLSAAWLNQLFPGVLTTYTYAS
jgi:dienelactone hydrolase